MKEETYVTINHLDECFGSTRFRVGEELILKKDHDNPYDDEAIEVYAKENYRCGYVANSVSTVARGSYSAGRIYDQIGETCKCVVRFITEDMLIAEVKENV